MAPIVRLAHRFWWLVIGGWVAIAAAAVMFAPSFAEVAAFDDTVFLPASNHTVVAAEMIAEGWPDDPLGPGLSFVVERPEGLTDADAAYLTELTEWLRSEKAPAVVGGIMSPTDGPNMADQFASEDGQAAFVVAAFTVSPYTVPATEAVAAIREHIDQTTPPDGLEVYVTGQQAISADEQAAIEATVGRTTIIAVLLVAAILLFVYRSLVAPLIPLATIGIAHTVALATVSMLAKAGLEVTAMYETFAIVLVFGAGTDYCLFLLSRYHEELTAGERVGFANTRRYRHGTLAVTTAVMVAVLASSAATTAVGLAGMGFAEFGLYRTMGPALAITIVVTFLAAVTLGPALMRLAGRNLFWPEWLGTPVLATGGEDEPLLLDSTVVEAAELERAPAEVAP